MLFWAVSFTVYLEVCICLRMSFTSQTLSISGIIQKCSTMHRVCTQYNFWCTGQHEAKDLYDQMMFRHLRCFWRMLKMEGTLRNISWWVLKEVLQDEPFLGSIRWPWIEQEIILMKKRWISIAHLHQLQIYQDFTLALASYVFMEWYLLVTRNVHYLSFFYELFYSNICCGWRCIATPFLTGTPDSKVL